MLAGNGNGRTSVLPALLALSIVLFVCMIGAYSFQPAGPVPARDTSLDAETQVDLLDPAPYRESTKSLESIHDGKSPSSGENVDPAAVRRLDVATDRIATMIRRGRRRALSVPEAGVDAERNSPGARAASLRWNDFARSWSASVNEMAGELPEHSGWSADSQALMAYQELEYALNELRNVTWSAASTTNIPFMSEREGHFDSAERRVETARRYLDELRDTESY